MKKILFSVFALALCVSALADDNAKNNFTSHLKWSGFIRNYATFDTRGSISSIEDFFYYLPKDCAYSSEGVDLNAQPCVTYAAITSRLILDVAGYKVNDMNVGAHVESDFYAGVSGVTGTAYMRLRQAFVTLSKNSWKMKLGQAWHPLAIDMPDLISLNTGSPFNPFSRTPQIDFVWNFKGGWTAEAAAIWQMQYTSAGPDGQNANYIKYGMIPEFYLGGIYSNKSFLVKAGVDVLSLKPRNNNGKHHVSDRITTVSPFVYLQYKKGDLTLRGKAIFAEAGEHLNLNGGYGKSEVLSDGSFTYTPTRNLSTWADVLFGKKLQGMLFVGYAKNFGTKASLFSDNSLGNKTLAKADDLYFSKNSFSNMNQMFRVSPTAIYNFGPKLSVALEMEVTDVQYGDYKKVTVSGSTGDTTVKCLDLHGLATDNLHWVINHRVVGMIRYKF